MDDKSTPIESLNNKVDDTEVVNKILSKYNNLQDGQTSIPPINNNIPQMEKQFEDRNLNQEIYNLNSNNIAYKDHYQKEVQRTNNQQNQQNNIQDYDEEQYEDEYDEYEVVEIPLWKRILNEIRIPFFIFIFILLISNCTFDKLLLSKLPILGNKFNECNTYGIIVKAILISIISYIFIRFIRF
jgi:hypothetical protein